MAFYAVARMADDIADHPSASPDDKLERLAAIESCFAGRNDAIPAAVHLRATIAARSLSARHVLDLLEAFRRDVTKTRYADWGELMDYCRHSAAPVGRYVLDIHGESRSTWPASDALCAALQVINHLQDCGQDYHRLDRVYLPLDDLERQGASLTDLGASRASPALGRTIRELAGRAQKLLVASSSLAGQVRNARLAMEIGAIQALASDLAWRLTRRDPLSQRVHHRSPEALAVGPHRRRTGTGRAAGGSAKR